MLKLCNVAKFQRHQKSKQSFVENTKMPKSKHI